MSRYEFSYNKEEYENVPCQNACPVHTDVKGYVNLISEGRFQEAYDLILETNPFPSVCGRVCQHFCEAGCSRKNLDKAVSICSLKRATTDFARVDAKKIQSSKSLCTLEKVAVVGAGPTGLTTAHDLAKLGYRVTVFESFPHGGGMLRYGIPAYRLPRDIIDYEISLIQALGVEIRYGVQIGKDIELSDLRKDYSAVFIAAGAHEAVKLGIPGEEYKGLIYGSTFMRDVNLEIDMGLKGKKLAVVGGGFSAMDVSRSAIRLGVTDAYILYRRTRDEIPVNEKEIEEAEDENVQFKYLVSPTRIVSNDGVNISGIELVKNELGEPDASGRRRPVPVKGSEFILDLDFIVPAVSQAPDASFIKKDGYSFQFNKWGNIDVDANSFETNVKGVFAGGDFLSGTRDVINVIAEAHNIAISIDKYIRGKEFKVEREIMHERLSYPRKERGYDAISRNYPKTIAIDERVSTFKEVENTFALKQAMEEGKRCLSCDHVWSHQADDCIVCANCEDVCPTNALSVPAMDELTHNRHFNEGISFTSMGSKPVLIDRDLCVRCGLCEQTCPVDCIEFSRCKQAVVAKV